MRKITKPKKQNPAPPPAAIQPFKEAISLNKHWLGLIIALFALAVYFQSIEFDYAYDDGVVIQNNKIVNQGLKGIPKLMVTDYWFGFSEELRVPEYRPASLVMFALENEFFPGNPHVSHLMNILLYALSCWLLFLLFSRMFSAKYLLYSFIGCIIFIVHPVHTEVVNNIKSRDEILCLLFAVLSLVLVLKYIDFKKFYFLILAALSFLGSLLSKETGITLIIIIPLLMYCFTEAKKKDYLKVMFVILGITVAFMLAWYQVTRNVHSSSHNTAIQNILYIAPDFMTEKGTAFFLLLKYVQLLLFPHPLSSDYSYAQISLHSFKDPVAVFGLILYLGIFVVAVLSLKKRKAVAFALLFYLLTLAPVSNVFIKIGATMAERFLYLPSIGFCILLIFFMIKLNHIRIPKNKVMTLGLWMKSNLVMLVVLTIIIGLFTVKTITRSQVWKNNVALFGHDVKIAKNSARAQFNWGSTLLADIYPKETDPEKKKEINEQAIVALNNAVQIFGDAYVYYYLLAQAYFNKPDYEKAILNFETYHRNARNPEIESYNNLAYAYLQTKQYAKALECSDLVLARIPDSQLALLNKAVALVNTGNSADSKILFEKILAINPNNSRALFNMGCFYGNEKNFKKSLEYFIKCSGLEPTNVACYRFMGMTYENMGDKENAKKCYDKVKQLEGK